MARVASAPAPSDAGDGVSDAGPVCASPPSEGAGNDEGDRAPLAAPLSLGSLEGIGVPVRDVSGATGVDGTVLLSQSRLGDDGPVTTPAELSAPAGKLCLSGRTVVVPVMNYDSYWGAGLSIYLRTELAAGAGAAPAASPDAGPASRDDLVFLPWDPAIGSVSGFSFVVESNDASLACGGLPPLLRVQTSPVGAAQTADIHCQNFRELWSGQRLELRFSRMTRECWDGVEGRAIFADPLPAGYEKQIYGLFWLVPADEVAAYPFDFCISDIRPIID